MGELKLYGMEAAFDEIMATAVKRQHEPQRIWRHCLINDWRAKGEVSGRSWVEQAGTAVRFHLKSVMSVRGSVWLSNCPESA
jgi:hypothetical protein